LLELGVLQRIAGDDDAYIRAASDQADALYDVRRRTLAGVLAAVRGPSTWPSAEAPSTLDERVRALALEQPTDSDEGRRTALRFALARRLLDDPVVYTSTLDPDTRSYFINQRGAMAARLSEATGLAIEQRAEGLALVDETGSLTDLALPAEGTDSHVTLLVAGFLAGCRDGSATRVDAGLVPDHDIVDFLRHAKERYGRYWRKSAREPGAERELAAIAVDRLERLRLIVKQSDGVRTLPALARFQLGEAETALPAARAPQTVDAFGPQSP
jgi:uncharacterized protein (TIGR02678 family)